MHLLFFLIHGVVLGSVVLLSEGLEPRWATMRTFSCMMNLQKMISDVVRNNLGEYLL